MGLEESLHKIVIKTETRFGHGDSSTVIFSECETCGLKSAIKTQYGWPANQKIMRQVLTELQNKHINKND